MYHPLQVARQLNTLPGKLHVQVPSARTEDVAAVAMAMGMTVENVSACFCDGANQHTCAAQCHDHTTTDNEVVARDISSGYDAVNINGMKKPDRQLQGLLAAVDAAPVHTLVDVVQWLHDIVGMSVDVYLCLLFVLPIKVCLYCP